MYTVNNQTLFVDLNTILQTLRDDFAKRQVDIFRVLKPSGNNIMTICPFHSGGRERNPSFGVSTQSEMKCHCFTCGWAGTLDVLISSLFGYDDEGAYGRKWLLKTFVTFETTGGRMIDTSIMNRGKTKTIQKYVSEEELYSYRYIHPYMFQRGLTEEIIEKFDVGYDAKTECITFPVRDINGNCVFVARRSVKTKFFQYPRDTVKPVYCAELFVEREYDYAVVCESILNCLTCWKYGIPAVALLGLGSDPQYAILKKLPVRKYVLAFDPDSAGERATMRFYTAMKDFKVLTRYDIPKGYDLNDLQEQIKNLVEFFI